MQGQIQDLAGGTIGNLSIVTLGFYDRCRCFSLTTTVVIYIFLA
jgi:hypothetical protein